jgi:16S rRNA C1402 (ribose-2'-O) methylase RsmI
MTKTDIMRLAAEAGLWVTSDERYEAVRRFAELVAITEREACASLCVEMTKWHSELVTAAYETAADAIRARSENE